MKPVSETSILLDASTEFQPSPSRHSRTPDPSLRPAVELRDLGKAFGPVWAVRGLSLNVASGEFLTLLGPSGSGKTTTLRMIAGFTSPTAGAIFVNGKDVTHLGARRRNIGMVFQSYALFPHMTAGANVSFPLEMRRMAREDIRARVGEILSLVGLGGLEDRYPVQLSGGQQQRVALARALVFQPGLLLMDEPLGALDKTLRDGLQSEVRGLQQRLGITVLYVTHDQEEALVMSDRIAVVRDGALVQVGTGEELYDRPVSLFVARFIGESNIFRGRLQKAGSGLVLSSNGSWLPVPASTQPRPEVEPGRMVAIMVRPEKVGFGTAIQGVLPAAVGMARITARARAATRLGAIRRFDFELSDGHLVRATLPAGARSEGFHPGDDVSIHWRVEDSVVLQADEDEEGEEE